MLPRRFDGGNRQPLRARLERPANAMAQ